MLAGCSTIADQNRTLNNEAGEDGAVSATYIHEGDKAAANGEMDKALVQYVLALEVDDENADVYYKVGYIHQIEGRADLAEHSFKSALLRSHDHIAARVSLGLIALRQENYQSAGMILNQVLQSDPHNWQALNALGVIHDLSEEFVLAGDFYQRALTVVPNSSNVLNNQGYSHYLRGNWREAERYFKQVVETDAEYTQGWSNLALVYLQLGDDDMAKIALRNVVNEHQALNNIGYFDLLRNDTTAAREKFIEAARIAPFYYSLAYKNLASLDANDSIVSNVKSEDGREERISQNSIMDPEGGSIDPSRDSRRANDNLSIPKASFAHRFEP